MSRLKKASVYWNSRQKTFSIKYAGEPIQHADTLWMEDCDFVVWQNGRLKVLRTKVKNVHAFIKGYVYLEKPDWPRYCKELSRVTYNPYYDISFSTVIGNKKCRIRYCKYISLHDGKVFRCI